MKPGLSLRVSQHLALTPQLQQSIRLLQLSTLELSQEVEQLLDENPFLERTDDTAEREAYGVERVDAPASSDEGSDDGGGVTSYEGSDEPAASVELERDGDWDGDGGVDMAPDDGEWGGEAPARNGARDDNEETDATELARSHESLQDHLRRQATTRRLCPEDRAALLYLIESLNDDGYLEDPIAELAAGLAGDDLEQREEIEQHFELALRLLQTLEPVGVGARNMGECLALQLRDLYEAAQRGEGDLDEDVIAQAQQLCTQPMELLARRDVKKLCQRVGGSEALTREALGLIARLEPKPGRRFVNVDRNIIVPDVLVARVGNGTQVRFRVQLNPDVMPRLRVHDVYANALKGRRGGRDEGHAALQQRLQEARWFIKNIQQRFDTILRVSTAIVERQRNFFLHGELAMRPLVLREIADELGLHESTISRVTTAKYMSTPFGTYELKYFFGSGLGTESGSNASSTAVRALIKQFVTAESVKKPLSDSQLSEMLKEQGIECARRTVAKYREALKIAPANLRKAL
jgi:RNA polymerase sigma-54 factor